MARRVRQRTVLAGAAGSAGARRRPLGRGDPMTTSATGPLAGVRVIELAGIGPGPYAAMMLADLGAEVVRVDRPGQGPDAGQPVTMRGRRMITLDLKNPDDIERLLSLVERADVVLEPFRPGVAERLGMGPDVCLDRNPRIVYQRMTGGGQGGAWAEHGLTHLWLPRLHRSTARYRSPRRCASAADQPARRFRRRVN